jgi:hypothetical protein
MVDAPDGHTLLLREILFFEAGEDDDPHIYLAPGVLPRWLRGDGGHSVHVADAPTVFGTSFGYTLHHDEAARLVTIDIPAPIPGVRYVYPCRLGQVTAAVADNAAVPAAADVPLPVGTRHAEITYA